MYTPLYCHEVCLVPVSCKTRGVGNQLGEWRYIDFLAIVYLKTWSYCDLFKKRSYLVIVQDLSSWC